MSNFRAMKFWIGDNPELSGRVQNILFGLGYKWRYGESRVKMADTDSLYTDIYGNIEYTNSGKHSFDNEEEKEINIDWMRTPKKVEYVELGGKKYIKEELEEALSKINPVEE